MQLVALKKAHKNSSYAQKFDLVETSSQSDGGSQSNDKRVIKFNMNV